MNEIQDFLLQELRSAKEKKDILDEEIHKIDINVDFINKAIDKIVASNDNTGQIFMSQQGQQGFDGEEIKKLNAQKQKLVQDRKNYSDKVIEVNKRIIHLKKLLQNDNQSEEGGSKVYNTYEVIYMQEADRQRIARDIHDTVVQGLTVLIHKNEFIEKIFETDKQRAHLEIEKNNSIIRESINELRNIIFDLRPMSLDDLGFEKTFYTVVEKMKNNTQMIIQADYLCKVEKVDPVISITAIRIIEELCNNSIKYSEGSKINIEIKTDDSNKYLLILYSDNGQGYDIYNDIQVRNNNTGFGLAMLKERIALLNGGIKVCYEENQLKYFIQIPLCIKKSESK